MDDVENLINWAIHVAIVVWQALTGFLFENTPWLTIDIAFRFLGAATLVVIWLVALWAPHLIGHDSWAQRTIIILRISTGVTISLNAVPLVAFASEGILHPAISTTH